MNLTLFFRLIVSVIFQPILKHYECKGFGKISYENTMFFCPRVYAKDGFNVSLQIHNGNYCESENGYRQFGLTWESVEFGFTSVDEPLIYQYADGQNDTTDNVGRVSVSVIEQVFEKHGGIDWEATLSVENMSKFLKLD